jgi:hypothetical protein
VSVTTELSTISSSLNEIAVRISTLVDDEGATMPSDLYNELVAAERTVGTLQRRLDRAVRRSA